MDVSECSGFTPPCLRGGSLRIADHHVPFPCVFRVKSCCVDMVGFLRCLEQASTVDSSAEHVKRLQDLDRDVTESLRMRGSVQPCARAFEEVRTRLMHELLAAEPVGNGRV